MISQKSVRGNVRAFRFGIAIGLAAAAVQFASAQNVEPSNMLHPSKDSWLTFHGDYTGQRHSGLTAITPQNVAGLKQAWKFSTGQTQSIKASPILADGV